MGEINSNKFILYRQQRWEYFICYYFKKSGVIYPLKIKSSGKKKSTQSSHLMYLIGSATLSETMYNETNFTTE